MARATRVFCVERQVAGQMSAGKNATLRSDTLYIIMYCICIMHVIINFLDVSVETVMLYHSSGYCIQNRNNITYVMLMTR